MVLEKNHPEQGNPDTERQIQFVLTHKWILNTKQRITSLQYTTPENTGSKENPERDIHGFPPPQRGK